jgi:hypothetical protein
MLKNVDILNLLINRFYNFIEYYLKYISIEKMGTLYFISMIIIIIALFLIYYKLQCRDNFKVIKLILLFMDYSINYTSFNLNKYFSLI